MPVLWFTVWTVLVLATLAGAFVLGRDLWRKGRALLAELERAADVVATLAERADALTDAAPTAPPRRDVVSDPAVHREHLAELRRIREQRRTQRGDRHAVTFARWRAYSR